MRPASIGIGRLPTYKGWARPLDIVARVLSEHNSRATWDGTRLAAVVNDAEPGLPAKVGCSRRSAARRQGFPATIAQVKES